MRKSYDSGNVLDNLEDAKEFKKRYDRGIFWGLVALGSSIVSVLLGALLDETGLPIALVVLGAFGIVISIGYMWLWFWYFHTRPGDYGRKTAIGPHQRLKDAERAFRDSLSTEE